MRAGWTPPLSWKGATAASLFPSSRALLRMTCGNRVAEDDMARNEDEMAKDLLACLHPRSGLDPDHAPRPRGEPGRLRWIVPAKPERFSWEGSDCEADACAIRGVSEARAGTRPVTSERRRICASRSSKHDRSDLIVAAKGREQRMTRITRIQARRVPWVHSPWMRPPGLDQSVSSVSSVVFRQKP